LDTCSLLLPAIPLDILPSTPLVPKKVQVKPPSTPLASLNICCSTPKVIGNETTNINICKTPEVQQHVIKLKCRTSNLLSKLVGETEDVKLFDKYRHYV